MRFPGLGRNKRIFVSLLGIVKRLAISLEEKERKNTGAWIRMNFQI